MGRIFERSWDVSMGNLCPRLVYRSSYYAVHSVIWNIPHSYTPGLVIATLSCGNVRMLEGHSRADSTLKWSPFSCPIFWLITWKSHVAGASWRGRRFFGSPCQCFSHVIQATSSAIQSIESWPRADQLWSHSWPLTSEFVVCCFIPFLGVDIGGTNESI